MTTEQTNELISLSEKLSEIKSQKKELANKKKILEADIKKLETEIIKALNGLNGVKLPNGTNVSIQETTTLKLIKGTKIETLPAEYTRLALDLTEVKKAYKESPFLVEFMQPQTKQTIKIK